MDIDFGGQSRTFRRLVSLKCSDESSTVPIFCPCIKFKINPLSIVCVRQSKISVKNKNKSGHLSLVNIYTLKMFSFAQTYQEKVIFL